MKKAVKNICLILVMLFVVITFSACGSMESQIIFNADGTIDEIVYFDLKTEDVFNAGYNVNEVKLWIYQEAQSEVDKIISAYNEQLLNDIYSSDVTRKNELNELKNGITKLSQNWQNNTLSIGIRFASSKVYKYYYDIGENNSEADEIKNGFFYNEYYYNSGTEYTKHRALFNHFSNKFNEQFPNLLKESDEMTFTYITTSKRLHSNADYIESYAGYYYHTWSINEDNIDDGVVLYYRVANPQNWIFLGLGLTASLLIILGFIALIINKNKKDNNPPVEIIINKNLLQKLCDRKIEKNKSLDK